MKKYIAASYLILMVIFTNCTGIQNTQVTIELTDNSILGETIYLRKINHFDFITGVSPDKNEIELIDSLVVESNTIVFSPDIDKANHLYRVDFKNWFSTDQALFLNLKKGDNVKIKCDSGNIPSYTIVKGDKNNHALQQIANKVWAMYKVSSENWKKWDQLEKSESELTKSEYAKKREELIKEGDVMHKNQSAEFFILLNEGFKRSDFCGLVALNLPYFVFKNEERFISELNKIISRPIDDSKVSEYLKKKKEDTEYRIAQKQRSENLKGKVIPDLELTGVDGTTFKISDKLGKITLVDFWASWCGSCIKENNRLVLPLYKKYHKLGFNVVGISLDRNKDKWIKSIKDQAYPWIHGVKKDKSISLNDIYHFNAIPYTLLLNEKGVVMDIQPRERLEEILNEELGKQN